MVVVGKLANDNVPANFQAIVTGDSATGSRMMRVSFVDLFCIHD
jgi:hypothetical protein